MCSSLWPPTLQWSNALQQAQTTHATCRLHRKKIYRNETWPFYSILNISVRKTWIFMQPWINSRQFPIIIRAAASSPPPERPRFGVSGGPPRLSEHRRLLPAIVRRAESTRGAEVLVGQMRRLHCGGQSFTSWEQSNAGIKSHIFRVMWPPTADTPPLPADACTRSLAVYRSTFNINIFVDKI